MNIIGTEKQNTIFVECSHNLLAPYEPLQEASGGVLVVEHGNWIPIICGGQNAETKEVNDKCYSLAKAYNNNGEWQTMIRLSQLRVARVGAASLLVANGKKLLVTGGRSSTKAGSHSPVDIVHVEEEEEEANESSNNSSSHPPSSVTGGSYGGDASLFLPAANLAYHCLERIGPDVAILIGGQDEGGLTYQTSRMLNLGSLEWSAHSLSVSRSKHACGVLKVVDPEPGQILDDEDNNVEAVVVAVGGEIFGGLLTASVDMMVVDNISSAAVFPGKHLSWQLGGEDMEMPEAVSMASAVTSADQSRLFVVGGHLEFDQPNLGGFELSCSFFGNEPNLPLLCQWRTVKQTIMSEPSIRGLALKLPPLPAISDVKTQDQCDPFDHNRCKSTYLDTICSTC